MYDYVLTTTAKFILKNRQILLYLFIKISGKIFIYFHKLKTKTTTTTKVY